MKKSITVAVIIILFPLFANASWYNPLSWFSFLGDLFHPKVQVVEKIVYVQATTTPTIATSTKVEATSNNTIAAPTQKKAKAVSKLEEQKIVPVSVLVSAPEVKTQATVTTADYNNIQSLYAALYRQIRNIIDQNNYTYPASSLSDAEVARAKFINALNTSLTADIGVLNTYSNKEMPVEALNVYNANISKYNQAFKDEEKVFNMASVKEGTVFLANRILPNIGDTYSQTTMYKAFYFYDKTFKTSYATKFNTALSVEQKAEVINGFLLDMSYN